jgi:hypothetical protein
LEQACHIRLCHSYPSRTQTCRPSHVYLPRMHLGDLNLMAIFCSFDSSYLTIGAVKIKGTVTQVSPPYVHISPRKFTVCPVRPQIPSSSHGVSSCCPSWLQVGSGRQGRGHHRVQHNRGGNCHWMVGKGVSTLKPLVWHALIGPDKLPGSNSTTSSLNVSPFTLDVWPHYKVLSISWKVHGFSDLIL